MERDRHAVIAAARVALGNAGGAMAWQRAKDDVAYAGGANAFKDHCVRAGFDDAAAGGAVADADDAFHKGYLLIEIHGQCIEPNKQAR